MLEEEVLVDESTQEYNFSNSGDLVLDPDTMVQDGIDANITESDQYDNEDQLIGGDLIIEDMEEDQEVPEVGNDLIIEDPEEEQVLIQDLGEAVTSEDLPFVGESVEPTDDPVADSADGPEAESSDMETLQALVEVIQKNQKTAAENMQLIGAIQIALLAMLFGGFVIYCFLHKLW